MIDVILKKDNETMVFQGHSDDLDFYLSRGWVIVG